MKQKKTQKASLKGKNILYFLIGLNMILLSVWMMFGMQTIESDFKEVVVIDAPKESSTVFVIEEKIPEEVEPIVEEPLPEPEIDLTDIEEVDIPLENPPKVDEPKPVKPTITFSGNVKRPTGKIDLTSIKDNAEKIKEEREIKPMNVAQVTTMAIYPGCEKYEDKKDLVNCFGQKLSKDILRYLDTEFPYTEKDQVKVQLEFHVNTKGEIVDINPIRGDEIFKPQAKKALEKVAKRLKDKGKLIIPAKDSKDHNAILKFQRSVVLEKP